MNSDWLYLRVNVEEAFSTFITISVLASGVMLIKQLLAFISVITSNGTVNSAVYGA